MRCLFASDLHGSVPRYRRLFELVLAESPDGVFLGGDLLPGPRTRVWSDDPGQADFLGDFLLPRLAELVRRQGDRRSRVVVILGNDDPRREEEAFRRAEADGLLDYVHGRILSLGGFQVLGYACVPPSPFLLKDWERYDVSRHVDPGCLSPEEGVRTVPADANEIRYGTIAGDLARLAEGGALDRAVLLLHAPPYDTVLDRAALDGVRVDHVPADVHVGSIAIRRFIEARQPLLALHGHVHESTRLTGAWRQCLGRTHCFQGAHDGPELSLIRFDTEDLDAASRTLYPVADAPPS